MKIYVYCEPKSNGAKDLVEQLNATRLRKFDGMNFWRRGKKVQFESGDVIVCWGKPAPNIEGLFVLNAGKASNKMEDLRTFAERGIPTVQYYSYKQAGFLPRKKYHMGGNDLLNPPAVPDFWVRKYNFTNEYRIHSFDGKSIRAGKKVPRAGWTVAASEEEWKNGIEKGELVAHPWIKSYDAGWKIDYTNFSSTKEMKALAHIAVGALGMTFGAVDMGELNKDLGSVSYHVLEVNRAPGLEGNTIGAYVEAINKWIIDSPERVKKLEELEAKKKEIPVAIREHPLAAQIERMRQRLEEEAMKIGRAHV